MIGLYISLACISALAGYALSLKMNPMYPGMKNVDWSQPDGGFFRDGEDAENPWTKK